MQKDTLNAGIDVSADWIDVARQLEEIVLSSLLSSIGSSPTSQAGTRS